MMTGSSAWRILIRNCLSHRSHEKVYSEAELSESRYWCGTLVNHVCRSPAKAPLVLGLQAKICTTCRSECNESLFSVSFSSYVDAAKKEEEGGEKRMSSSSLTKVITLTLLQDLNWKKMGIEFFFWQCAQNPDLFSCRVCFCWSAWILSEKNPHVTHVWQVVTNERFGQCFPSDFHLSQQIFFSSLPWRSLSRCRFC